MGGQPLIPDLTVPIGIIDSTLMRRSAGTKKGKEKIDTNIIVVDE
jgi:hypothetical protein